MQRPALFVGFLFLAVLYSSAISHTVVHDFHYSRFGIEWNAETSTWQGILRVFTDDLEMALSQMDSEAVIWRLGDERENPQSDVAIETYATSNWFLVDSAGQALKWDFVGKEVDYDLTFIYLESEPTTTDWACSATSRGFFELFDDQVNELTITKEENSLRLWLTLEDPTKPILSPRHE